MQGNEREIGALFACPIICMPNDVLREKIAHITGVGLESGPYWDHQWLVVRNPYHRPGFCALNVTFYVQTQRPPAAAEWLN